MADAIARFFAFQDRATNLRTEVRAGLATFLTMAYILFVNPAILSDKVLGTHAMSFSAAAGGTALAAGIACILMGLIANYPLALASGMGLNGFLAYTVIAGHGVSWQVAMGFVVLDGIVVLALVLLGARESVLRAIPLDLKRAIGAGIGLFLAVLGLVNARIIVIPRGTVSAYAAALEQGGPTPTLPPVAPGELATWGALLTLFGVVVTAVLLVRKVRGAVLIGILATTALAIGRDLVMGNAGAPVFGLAFAAPDLSAVGQADIAGALRAADLLPLILGLVIVDFFDTLGTMTAVGEQAGLVAEDGSIPRSGKVLAVDAASAAIGGLCGASSVTSYVESAAGVSEGGRTGLSAIVTGVLFLVSLGLAPLFGLVPPEATAAALIVVGLFMVLAVAEIDWKEIGTALPAFVTMVTMPLTYSISHGIGYGFILYVLIALLSGRGRQVHPVLYVVAAVFAGSFVLVAGA